MRSLIRFTPGKAFLVQKWHFFNKTLAFMSLILENTNNLIFKDEESKCMVGDDLLNAKKVTVSFLINGEWQTGIYDVDLDIAHGEVLALVGESGSGKSTFATSVIGLHNKKQTHVTGSITLDGQELIDLPDAEENRVRGEKIGMIFQDPLAALNPLMKIGQQIQETLDIHDVYQKDQYHARVIELLDEVGIVNPERTAKQYPHELSGGMRQRVMIALAIANDPDLIIADEPTTALDTTIQAQILDVLLEIRDRKETGILLITHDLGVVAEVADSVAVMYAGQIVEKASVQELFEHPLHPYTRSLLRSNPEVDREDDELYVIPGTVPALSEMDHHKDLFLQRVPWMQAEADVDIPDELVEARPNHFVRGTAWRTFEFPDQKG